MICKMSKKDYLKAVKKAQRILGYVRISDKRRAAVRLSRNKASQLVRLCHDTESIDAEWADDEHTILLVG